MPKFSNIVEKGISKLEDLEQWNFVDWFEGRGRDYGCETGQAVRKNVQYFSKFSFKMKTIGSAIADTSFDLFGNDLDTPVMPGAMSGLSQICENPLKKIAAGSCEAGSVSWMGIGSKDQFTSMCEACDLTIKISKPYENLEKIIDKLGHAEDQGAVAVGVDTDFVLGGKRADEPFRKEGMGIKSLHDLEEIISTVDVPFIIKGVLSVEDAQMARKSGADAIVVSNHGGVVLDFSAHPLEVLEEITEEVGDEMRVLVDSGFRRGTDVMKGLALGADGVLIGIDTVVGLAAGGSEGVKEILEAVTEDLRRAMTLTGCSDLKQVDEDILVR